MTRGTKRTVAPIDSPASKKGKPDKIDAETKKSNFLNNLFEGVPGIGAFGDSEVTPLKKEFSHDLTVNEGELEKTFENDKAVLKEVEEANQEQAENERKERQAFMKEISGKGKLQDLNEKNMKELKNLIQNARLFSNFVTNRVRKTDGEKEEQQPGIKRLARLDYITGGTLREHQLDGVEWLASLYENGLNGILADEMGLGKTLQAIAFIAHLRAHKVMGPFLVVAPLSTIHNWQREVERFAPSIPVRVYHGNKTDRPAMRREIFKKHKNPEDLPIVITSYEMLMVDIQYFERIKFKYLVVDEAQRAKNAESRFARELAHIQADNKVLLTGTPLQNNLYELWSLLHCVLPSIFRDLESFQSWFNCAENEDISIMDEQSREEMISKLHEVLDPFLLRRVKADVLDELPQKKEVIVYAPMSKLQEKYYRWILESPEQFSEKFTDPVTGKAFTPNLRFVLMQLRKVCNHPYLIHEEANEFGVKATDETLVEASGKLALLDKMLKSLIKDGHRVLIFNQMARMVDIMEDYLMMRGIRYCRIDGSVQIQDRVDAMRQFENDSDIKVFLLTTRAGGLGINLIGADTVIFFDSDWNPQMDIQAQARCHRIGQTKPVAVYRLATVNSVEVKILQRAREKRTLEQLVLEAGNFKDKNLYTEERDKAAEVRTILENAKKQKIGVAGAISDSDLNRILKRSVVMKLSQSTTATETRYSVV